MMMTYIMVALVLKTIEIKIMLMNSQVKTMDLVIKTIMVLTLLKSQKEKMILKRTMMTGLLRFLETLK